MQSDLTESNHCIEQDNSVEQSFMKKKKYTKESFKEKPIIGN